MPHLIGRFIVPGDHIFSSGDFWVDTEQDVSIIKEDNNAPSKNFEQ